MIDVAIQYGKWIIGFLAVFLLAYWTFDERDQTEAWADTIERVGERARTTTGGLVGAAGSLAIVAIAMITTIGTELVESSLRIATIIGMDPVLSGGFLTGVLGWLGIRGSLQVEAWQFGLIVVALLIGGVIWRERTEV